MSTQTANYHLTKPEDNDYYDIGVPNGNMDIIDTELKSRDISLTTHEADAVAHTTQVEKDKISGAVQSATIGGAAVPKSGMTLQLPAYPTSLPADGGNAETLGGKTEGQLNVNYAAGAGTSNLAHYSSHAVGSGGAALRNNTATVGGSPSGGSDGDGWDICT